jgi:drug/metabolite transporter (DMT)-like permease
MVGMPETALRQAAAKPEDARQTLVALCWLAVALVWGSTYLGIRVALEAFPPLGMAGARFLLAGTLLYGFLRLRGLPAPTRKQWGGAAITGFFLLTVGNGAVALAEQRVSSSLAALMCATMPLWTAVLGLGLGHPPTRRDWLGLAVGFGGVALLELSSDLRSSGGAAVVLALAPLSWAAGTLLSRRVALPSGAMATAAQMLTGGALMAMISLARGETLTGPITMRAVGAVLYLVAFGSLLAFSAYTYLVRNARPQVTTSYAYVNPVVAMALGAAFGERVTGMTCLAAAIVLCGVALITLSRRRRAG